MRRNGTTPTKDKAAAKDTLRYEEIAQQLRTKIQRGTYRPGDRMPSLRALRAEYGITQATVDKAHDVLEKEGLIVRSARSGIYVARPGSKPRSGIIGFQGVDFTQTEYSPYWSHLVGGVEAALRERDAQILLLSKLSPSGWDKVDGVLLNGGESGFPTDWLVPDIPVVSFFVPPLFTGKPADKKRAEAACSLVTPDDYHGIRTATEHLLKLGHKRIAYLNNSRADKFVFPIRLAGYHDALKNAGIQPQANWLHALTIPSPAPRLFFRDVVRQEMERWLRTGWKKTGCTAILALNDDAARGIIEALEAHGLRVPEDVSVAGCDGIDCANPTLTTVEIPLPEIGRKGVELLWERLEGPAKPASHVTVETKLRVGETTAPL